jgi:hypothetical protein
MQILAESPAWLSLLVKAHSRVQAEAALLDGQVTLASMAATQTKEGGKVWQKLARQLERGAGREG